MANALLKTGKHTVTAITRADSKSKLPDGIKVAKVDYTDESSLIAALKGQQFLLITMSFIAPPDSQQKIIAAAAKAKVPYVMPNCWGIDVMNKKLADDSGTGPMIKEGIKAVEDGGVSSWIVMCCSFWYEFSLAMGEGWYGFDFPNKTVTFYDDGKTKINTSTWDQCGRAIAAFLSLKELPEDENDTSPTISEKVEKALYISSFLVSQRDMMDSVNRIKGTTDADWMIKYEPTDVRYKRGLEIMKTNFRYGFGVRLYSRVFYPNGDGNIEDRYGLANNVLGLPSEDFDVATKRAVDMVESGWGRDAS